MEERINGLFQTLKKTVNSSNYSRFDNMQWVFILWQLSFIRSHIIYASTHRIWAGQTCPSLPQCVCAHFLPIVILTKVKDYIIPHFAVYQACGISSIQCCWKHLRMCHTNHQQNKPQEKSSQNNGLKCNRNAAYSSSKKNRDFLETFQHVCQKH